MLLTVKELADQLHIKPSTLYAWAAQGRIPCFKLHGLVRFAVRPSSTGSLVSGRPIPGVSIAPS